MTELVAVMFMGKTLSYYEILSTNPYMPVEELSEFSHFIL